MSDLQNEMERIGRILAGDQGLSVKVQGLLAYATPGEIVLPNISTWEVLGRDARKMLNGLCDHECGHALFSDFKLIHAVKSFCDGKSAASAFAALGITEDEQARVHRHRRIIAHMVNAIEDGWMERAQGRRYPGARVNMDRKNQWFWTVERDGKGARATMEAGQFPAFALAVTLITRKSRVIADFKPWPQVHAALEKVEAIIAEVDACRSSVTALRLALRMLDALSDEDKSKGEPEPDESKGEGDDKKDDGEDDEGKGRGKDKDAGEAPESTESEDAPESTESEDDGEEADGEDKGDDDGDGGEEAEGEEADGEDKGDDDGDGGDEAEGEEAEGEDKGEPEPETSEQAGSDDGVGHDTKAMLEWDPDKKLMTPESLISGLITEAMLNTSERADYLNLNPEDGLVYDVSDVRTIVDVNVEATVAATVGPLVSAFEAGLRARNDRRLTPGSDEGVVDTEMLAAFAAGGASADEIFMELSPDESRNTAVTVLVDCSGSMGAGNYHTSKSWVARHAAQAMVTALTTLQVPVEVLGFTSVDSGDYGLPWMSMGTHEVDSVQAFADLRAGLVKQEAMGIPATKFAREVYRSAATLSSATLLLPAYAIFKHFDGPLGGIAGMTGIHENLDGEAVLFAARRLIERHEPRKVMFVLSDGAPAGSRDNTEGARFLKESVDMMIESGIEVYAIGIQSEAVKAYYPRHIVVRDLSDLTEVALDALTEMLVECRQGD